ncbi:hypothetical protein [Desulfomonile tiedjei]|uniref:Uncharacterized protein n=1 Tax=Desulfomonile tiedjei (strain ATCC 49306 / DSM 6799 / DCB-1) TaxID=706587 RepID=I4C1G2_DESTA|nr:hypothetical protein [Desulfomonile tiedjei]AFM23403.1 hypothetical protein Desti_0677 [Desulfomonile tiedjei DSM 6799]
MERRKIYLGSAILLASLIVLVTAVPVSWSASNEIFDAFEQCKIDCNEAYGGLDIFPSKRAPVGHADCILKCERRFWKAMDRENRKLEKR